MFNQHLALLPLSLLVLAGVLDRPHKIGIKIERFLILLANLSMAPLIFSGETKIFDLKTIYLFVLSFQIASFFCKLKNPVNLHIVSLLFVTHFLSVSDKLAFDLPIVGSIIVLLLLIFHDESAGVFICFSILPILFLIFVLGMTAGTTFVSYDKLVVNSIFQYSTAMAFLFFLLFFIIFSLPSFIIKKLSHRFKFDLKFVLAIGIFYYAFLSKFTWVFQQLLRESSPGIQQYFETVGNIAFGICFIIWFFGSIFEEKKWEDKFITLFFLNCSVALLMILIGADANINTLFQWLLLSVIIPFFSVRPSQ